MYVRITHTVYRIPCPPRCLRAADPVSPPAAQLQLPLCYDAPPVLPALLPTPAVLRPAVSGAGQAAQRPGAVSGAGQAGQRVERRHRRRGGARRRAQRQSLLRVRVVAVGGRRPAAAAAAAAGAARAWRLLGAHCRRTGSVGERETGWCTLLCVRQVVRFSGNRNSTASIVTHGKGMTLKGFTESG